MNRVDQNTLVCRSHQTAACIVCMMDEFHDWQHERQEKRARYKREWAETPVHERFDLGGEG